MEEKRKTETGEREAEEIPQKLPWKSRVLKLYILTQRQLPGWFWPQTTFWSKGRCLGYNSFQRAGVCWLTAIFAFPVSTWQGTNPKKTPEWSRFFSISSILLQVGLLMPKGKIKGCFQGQTQKVHTSNNRKLPLHNNWAGTDKQQSLFVINKFYWTQK